MMERGHRATRHEWLAVAGAFLTIVLAASVWLAVDRRPPEWDYANHLERAVNCARDVDRSDVRTLLERSSFYPPLVPCLAGLLYRLAPSDVAAAQSVVLLFLGAGMAATYLVGRRLAGGAAGVIAALVFGSAPFVLFLTVRFQLDLPLASLVVLTVHAVLESDGFRHRGWSVATGALVGLGLLTKPPFVAFLAVPLGLAVLRLRRGRAVVNLIVATAIASALALPWYGPRLAGLPMQIGNRSFKQAAEAGAPDPATWAGLSFYPRSFVTQFGAVAVVLFVVGLVVAVRRRQWLALATLLVPFVAFEMIQNKNVRYTLPLLPLAAALAGLGFSAFARPIRWIAGGVVAVVAVLQIGATLFALPTPRTLPGLDIAWVPPSPPTLDDWKQRDILALIARHAGNRASIVSVVPNAQAFSVSNFRYYALRDGLPFRFVRAWDDPPLGIEYMILKSGDQGPSWTAEKPRRIGERFAGDANLARVFPAIGEFPLPDGSAATLRARVVPAVAGAAPGALAEAIDAAIRRQLSDVARNVDRLGITLDYDDTILSGHVRRIEITARAATIAEFKRRDAATLRVRDLRIVVDDALVNPFSARLAGRLDALDAGRVSITDATVSAPDLQRFFGGLRGFDHASVALEEGAMAFRLVGRGPSIVARVRIRPATDRPFRLEVERVSVGGLPVPDVLVDWVVRNFDPSPQLAARLPFHVAIGSVTIDDAAVRISSTGETIAR